MKITEKQFKIMCEKQFAKDQNRLDESLFFYFYATDENHIPNDGVTSVDLVSYPTIELAEKVVKHTKSYAEKIRVLGLRLNEEIKPLKAKQAAIEMKEDLIATKSDDKFLDDLGNDPELKEHKLNWASLKDDEEDLDRIYTIDIKNTFSFMRIANYSKVLMQLSHTLSNYDQEDVQVRIVRFSKLVEYSNGLNDKFNQLSGYWAAQTGIDINAKLKEFHSSRTSKSTEAKRKNRRIKEVDVCYEYIQLLKKTNKETIKQLSENKMAGIVREHILADLKAKGIGSISIQTIIDILRKRNKERIPFYPWEEKTISKM
jgi:hypothetical protein